MVCIPKGPDASTYISGILAGSFFAIPSYVEDIKSVANVMASLFSYNDTTKDVYYDYEEKDRKRYSDDLYETLTKNAKYIWFLENPDYRMKFINIWDDILKNDVPIDTAIEKQRTEILNNLTLLNQEN